MADISARAVLIDNMSKGLKKIGDNSKAMAKGVNTSAKKANESIKGMGSSLISLKGALAGVAVAGVGVFAKSILSASSQMEKLETQFKVLLKDTDSAKARMQELSKFAQTTPFQLEEVANASRVLQTLGGSAFATGDSLRMVGDASAIAGESFENLAIHIGRAYSGLQANRPIGESLARLQELGLVSGTVRNQIEDLTKAGEGKKAWTILQTELKKTEGGMKELSKTMGGLTSTLKDQFQSVLRDLGSGGFFDAMKSGLAGVVEGMNNLLDSGFFKRVGAGFSFLLNAGMVFINGLQGGFAQLNEMVANFIWKTIDGFLMVAKKIPAFPDKWIKGLEQAKTEYQVVSAQFAQTAQEDFQEGADAIDGFLGAWHNMVNGVPVGKYTEKNQKATKSDQKRTSDLKKELKKREDAWKEFLENNLAMRQEVNEQEIERANALGEFNQNLRENNQKAFDDATAQETAIAKKGQQDRKRIYEQEAQDRLKLATGLTSALSTISQNALKGDKKNAKIRQGIAISEAVINTALGVTNALSRADFGGALLIGAQGTAQVSTIATQKFATGGIVKGEAGVSDVGDKTMVRVNAGEGVFTKDQMKALGDQKTITIAPTIQVNGNADESTVQGLVSQSKQLAEAIIDSIRNNDLDLKSELNLVSA